MPGASTWNFGEAFAHLYLDSVAMNHNSIGRGYETFGNGTAETLQWTLDSSQTSREWYRVMPPPTTPFLWSARDNVNYQQTAALAALDMAASQSKALLRNFYRKGYNSWRKGVDEAPYAFAIPATQGDPMRVAQLVERIAVAAHRSAALEAAFTVKEGAFAPAPTSCGSISRIATTRRSAHAAGFPKDGGEPYDDVSWELPAHYHVAQVRRSPIRDQGVGAIASTEAPQPRGKVSRQRSGVRAEGHRSGRIARSALSLAKLKIEIAEHAFKVGDTSTRRLMAAAAQVGTRARLAGLTAHSRSTSIRSQAVPYVARHAAKAPRLWGVGTRGR
jgi:hypothetical protein